MAQPFSSVAQPPFRDRSILRHDRPFVKRCYFRFRSPYSSSGASLQTRRPIDWSNLVYVKAFQPMLGLANEVASQPVGKPDHEDSSEGEKE